MKIKRVLLVQPPENPFSFTFGKMIPLSLMILGSSLEKAGYKVKILDMRFGPYSLLEKTLNFFQPDVVGITGITLDYPKMLEVLWTVKRFSSGKILTVVGGHHASMASEDFCIPWLAGLVDFIVKYHAVNTFPALLEAISSQENFNEIPGIFYKDAQGDFVENPGRDKVSMKDFPRPANHLLPNKIRKKYRFDGLRWGLVVSSQGCPARCAFCACWKIMDGKYIARNAKEIVEEIARMPEKNIFLGDDHTFAKPEKALMIAQLIKERGIKKTFQAYCRADMIVKHPEVFEAWAEIGLFALTVGIEALTNEELGALNKGSSVEVGVRANRILADLGIHNYAHILIRPDFTISDFDRVWQYVYENGILHPVFPVLTPLPGTDLKEEIGDMLYQHELHDLGHPLLPTTLLIEEFYREYMALLQKNYSLKRWFKAHFKGLVNKLAGREVFRWYEVRAPEFYILVIARAWLWAQSRPNKLEPFFVQHRAYFSRGGRTQQN